VRERERERERERIIIREGGSDQFFGPSKGEMLRMVGLQKAMVGAVSLLFLLLSYNLLKNRPTQTSARVSQVCPSIICGCYFPPLLLLLSQSNPNQPISNREEEEEEVARSWN
jgi:hypothetical protein